MSATYLSSLRATVSVSASAWFRSAAAFSFWPGWAMKAFAHPGQNEKAAADLNQALADTLTVARNELKYVADIETDFGDLPPVVCHLADLNQVFLNLLVNSAQAIGCLMKESGVKGRIRVKTRTDGDCVTVSISDTGCGIPEAIKSLVFDQFFTTKEAGH